MIEILAGTPIWVYPLFLLVIWLGLSAARQRIVRPLALVRLPAIFAIWSILNIWLNSKSWGLGLAAWAGGVLIGASIGYALFRSMQLALHADAERVVVPGTWWTLCLVVAIFAMNYVFGYLRATSPGLLESQPALVPALSGLAGGIFIGQAGVYLGKVARLRAGRPRT